MNHKQVYQYFCVDENDWIDEERVQGSIPTQCKNNASHTIKANSTRIKTNHYCYYTEDNTIPERFDVTSLNYASLSADNKKIVELLVSLLKCAELRGLIKYV